MNSGLSSEKNKGQIDEGLKEVVREKNEEAEKVKPRIENIQHDFEKETQKSEKVSQGTTSYIPDEEEKEESKELFPSVKEEDSNEISDLSKLKTERDEDIIERPWVDRAEQIIKKYKDDPHKEDNEEAKLQVKYLKDRFGREVKKPKD